MTAIPHAAFIISVYSFFCCDFPATDQNETDTDMQMEQWSEPRIKAESRREMKPVHSHSVCVELIKQ